MGDEDGCPVLHNFAKMVEDLVFGMAVNAVKRIVQNQDPGVADDGAGNGCALLLSSRESYPTLADESPVLLRKIHKISSDIGSLGCRTGVRAWGILIAERM